jgi:hypothetical protein
MATDEIRKLDQKFAREFDRVTRPITPGAIVMNAIVLSIFAFIFYMASRMGATEEIENYQSIMLQGITWLSFAISAPLSWATNIIAADTWILPLQQFLPLDSINLNRPLSMILSTSASVIYIFIATAVIRTRENRARNIIRISILAICLVLSITLFIVVNSSGLYSLNY